jgi:virginiamycin B lyase
MSPAAMGRRHIVIVAVLGAALVAAAALWLHSLWIWRGFTEYRMERDRDIPTAIAVSGDGAVWFTLDFADAIGVLREGRIERIPIGRETFEPLGLAVDRDGAAWYTDSPTRVISRVSRDGVVASFALSTPVAKLARLAAAPDGAVWFAEESTGSFTRLKDGAFTRHAISTPGIAPFGVAVDASGTVWGTLPRINRLVRISARGEIAELDPPTRAAQLGDVAVGADGAVWFLEMQANKIGRFANGQFTEFLVPTKSAGLTSLAIAPDGAVWFTELRGQRLGRLRDGVIVEFPLPRSDARPFGIAVDGAGNVWYTDLSGALGRLSAERARGR